MFLRTKKSTWRDSGCGNAIRDAKILILIGEKPPRNRGSLRFKSASHSDCLDCFCCRWDRFCSGLSRMSQCSGRWWVYLRARARLAYGMFQVRVFRLMNTTRLKLFLRFRCSACDASLSNWYFEKDGLLFCKEDYWSRYGESCQQCSQVSAINRACFTVVLILLYRR